MTEQKLELFAETMGFVGNKEKISNLYVNWTGFNWNNLFSKSKLGISHTQCMIAKSNLGYAFKKLKKDELFDRINR